MIIKKQNLIKICIISLMFIFSTVMLTQFVCAANNVNMNLPANTQAPADANNNANNTTDNTVAGNREQEQRTNSSMNATQNQLSNTTSNSPVSNVSRSNEESSELGFTNILNIILIVIGTLLVLLSIAILIRLKK